MQQEQPLLQHEQPQEGAGEQPAETAQQCQVAMPQTVEVETLDARQFEASLPRSFPLSTRRLKRPHDFFPFDLFRGGSYEGYLGNILREELSYVRDHCMIPPFPWGHVIYHDFIVANLQEVPGDFAEFGIGLGGTSIFLARIGKSMEKKFLAVDSFEGLPPPDLSKENHYFLEGDYRPLAGEDNYRNFLMYKSTFDVDETLYTIKGFFKDIEIPPNFQCFSFVHLDSDLYDSVYDSLEKVWDRISPGGAVAIDDFFHHAQGPARAVSDFFRLRGEDSEPPLLFVIPTYAVLIIKGRSACLRRQADGSPLMYGPRALDGNFYCFVLMRNCMPFRRAAEDSLKNAEASLEEAVGTDTEDVASRVYANAKAFCEFLNYADDSARSGNDILRYLLPLEDMFDMCQGQLCGMPKTIRKTIEIGI